MLKWEYYLLEIYCDLKLAHRQQDTSAEFSDCLFCIYGNCNTKQTVQQHCGHTGETAQTGAVELCTTLHGCAMAETRY